jgi:RNA polymerase sigma-70 factor (ECF subfamily)
MLEQSELELVKRAKAGDKEAFGTLVERYEPSVKRLALNMTGSREMAGELVQEAMLQAYLSLAYLRNEASFKSWFYGITLNLARTYRREAKLIYTSLDTINRVEGDKFFPVESLSGDPPSLAEKRELYRRLLIAISELSPRNREAIRLYYFEELSLSQIGLALGISAGAVKGRLHKARQALKADILPDYPELVKPAALERKRPMIEVTISDVMVKKIIGETPYTVIILLDKAGNRFVPIWISLHEGEQIAVGLRNFPLPRPLTYSFIRKILEATGTKLEEVRVESLKEDIFYGIARLRVGRAAQELDARPSDVLALAVQVGCPIYVSEEVFEKAGMPLASLEEKLGPDIQGMDSLLNDLEIKLQSRLAKLKEVKPEPEKA